MATTPVAPQPPPGGAVESVGRGIPDRRQPRDERRRRRVPPAAPPAEEAQVETPEAEGRAGPRGGRLDVLA